MLAGTAALVLLIAGASPLAAQAFGLPVTNSGLPTGIGFAADAGFANDAAGGGWAPQWRPRDGRHHHGLPWRFRRDRHGRRSAAKPGRVTVPAIKSASQNRLLAGSRR